jgi:membrane fusion protein (multidrug efflux system)
MSSDTEALDGGGLAEPTTESRRGVSPRQIALAAGAVLLAAAAIAYGVHWWTVGRFIVSTDDAYVGADVTEIAPHVSGFISEIAVKDNQYVHAGQLLISIAPADFKAARAYAAGLVRQAQASVASLQARMALQRSLILQAQADLTESRDQAHFDQEDAIRFRALARTGAASIQEEQRAETAYVAAQSVTLAAIAKLTASRQQLAVLGAALRQAKATVQQAQAQLRTADLNVGYTKIRSPIAGFVGDRTAQVGAYVSAGTQLLSIAPAQGLWVDANFKEGDIAYMRPGQPASIVADVDAAHVLHGHVASVAPATGAVFSVIPPQNATGNFTKIVQRVPVRIALDRADGTLGLLRPGLSATVSVDTRQPIEAGP